ncbi:MAG TPA: efflux RND transporter periplasmic adaptor subunit [Povalibacter sp.]|nr:efflux RND transporter periplasmic adaptor subunit [Povalibacter sp.]
MTNARVLNPLVQLLALLAGIAGLAGCDGKAQETTVQATPVRIATAFTGPAAPTIRTNGMLVNKDEIRLSFKVGGVIRHIAVQEGERVHAGQKLAEIELTEVNAQVEQARQAHEKALRDLQRGERLYADQVISLEQLQDLRTQTAVSDAALQSAQFNSSYSAIIAPRDGTVLRRLAEERELVAAGAPVLVLGAQDRGYVVRAGLADREIVQIKLNDTAQIRLDALPQVTLTGKVTEIASAADPASGMFSIEVALDSTDQPLKSGLVAKLSLVPAAARAAERVFVPIAAIVEGDGRKASVFVLEQDRVRRREVEVAFIENDAVAVTGGINSGEQVVTDGSLYLEDGEAVAVQPPADASSGPAEMQVVGGTGRA